MKKKIDLEMIQIRKYPVQNIPYMQKGGKKKSNTSKRKRKTIKAQCWHKNATWTVPKTNLWNIKQEQK